MTHPLGTGRQDENENLLLQWLSSIFSDSQETIVDFKKHLSDNPGRINRAYQELLSGYKEEPHTILKVTEEIPDRNYSGLILSSQMSFVSFCAHHFLPFMGTADVIYEAGPYIIGLGKIPRLIHCRTRRFALQEFIARDVCEDMMDFAQAKGVFVRIQAQHTCLCYRGPSTFVSSNTTTYSQGSLSNSRELEVSMLLSLSR